MRMYDDEDDGDRAPKCTELMKQFRRALRAKDDAEAWDCLCEMIARASDEDEDDEGGKSKSMLSIAMR